MATEVNLLTAAGAAKLRDLWDESGITGQLRWTRELTRWTPDRPIHQLRTTDTLVAFEAAAKFADLPLTGWADEAAIVQFKSDGAWTAAIAPDGLVQLSDRAHQHAFVFEVDCDTEALEGSGRNVWARKVTNYAALFAAIATGGEPYFRDRPSPWVVTVAPTQARAQRLLTTTEKYGGAAHFWFGTFAALEDPTTLLTCRWMLPGRDDGWSLAEAMQL